jgi:hypothetical protein
VCSLRNNETSRGFPHTMNFNTHDTHIVQLLLSRRELSSLGKLEPEFILLRYAVNLQSVHYSRRFCLRHHRSLVELLL